MIAALFFGLYPPAAKMAYLDGANQTFIIIITTSFRALGMLACALYQGHCLSKIYKDSRESLYSGFLQAVSIFGIIASLYYIPGPVAITVIFTHTIMLLFIMAYKKEIKISFLLLIVTLTALFGISLVVGLYSNVSNINITGLSLAFIGAIATASRLYSFGKQVLKLPQTIVGAQVFSYAALFTLLLVFYQVPELPKTSTGWFWTIACCLSLTLGTVGMFLGISKVGSFKYSLFVKLEPIFTSIYSIIILNEFLDFSQYLGILILLASLVIYQVCEVKRVKI